MPHLFPLLMFLSPDEGGGEKPPEKPPEKPKEEPDPKDAKLAELEKWKSDREKADKVAAEEAAKKKGEFESLHKSEKERADAAETRLKELEKKETERLKALKADNEEALKALPQEIRDLSPDGADPDQMHAWLKRATRLHATERPAGTPPRPQGSTDLFKKHGLTDEEKQEAKRRGVSEEKWFEILVKSGRKKIKES